MAPVPTDSVMLSFRCSPELADAIRRRAAVTGRSMTEVIIASLHRSAGRWEREGARRGAAS